jgi:radical SAM superfamily enzyme YgiQ (UPF0313 family)
VAFIRPPFFTPMSPPLGLGLLKAFLESHGHRVRCFDTNVDSALWATHHRYFGVLEGPSQRRVNDGYSKFWFVLNAHMQAYVAGADGARCARVLEAIAPLYGLQIAPEGARALHMLVVAFFKRLAELIDDIDLADCDFIGTSTYTTSLAASLFTLERFKRRYPRARTIMGGGVFFDDLARGSSNLERLLQGHDFVDHVVLGEGELLTLRLIDGDFEDKRLVTVADLGRATLPVFDIPIPDFSDFDLDNYFYLSIEGGRSCPFQCSFCSETVQWGDYRKKPSPLLAEQMGTMAQRYGKHHFFMGDSLMNPYVQSLSAALLQRGIDVLYDGYLRADKSVVVDDRSREWARSGMYRARLGLETGSDRLLGVMQKMTTTANMSAVLRCLAERGVRTTTYWIVGYPGESEQDFDETLAFIRDHQRFIYELEAHPYYYYPYGQVSSRLFQSRSLHPDDLADVLKFDTWEVVDVCPSREERFQRLATLSSVASDLGLPNIYSMAERYAAEERWLSLWPTAVEVY